MQAPGRPSARELRWLQTPQPRCLSGRGRDPASAVPGAAGQRPPQVRRRWLRRVGPEDGVFQAVLFGSVGFQLCSGSQTARFVLGTPHRQVNPTPVPLKVPQSVSPVCAVTRDVCPQLVPKCRKSSAGPAGSWGRMHFCRTEKTEAEFRRHWLPSYGRTLEIRSLEVRWEVCGAALLSARVCCPPLGSRPLFPRCVRSPVCVPG